MFFASRIFGRVRVRTEQREFVRRLARKTVYKIVALLHLDRYIPVDEKYAGYAPYDITPADFVSLVKYGMIGARYKKELQHSENNRWSI